MAQKAVLVAAWLALGLALTASGVSAQSGAAQKNAEDIYKNIQVLKGVPADQWNATMQFIATALGTQCSHCHVQGAFDKDDKSPKEFARVMIKMVFDLNQNTFGGRQIITCYTCHRGNLRPIGTLDPATMGRPSQVPGLVGNQPSAIQMLDKYLQALGGMDAIAKVTTRIAKGKMEEAANPPSDIEIYLKSPDHSLIVTHVLGSDSSTGYSGDAGWTSNSTSGIRDMASADTQGAQLEDNLYLASNAKKIYHWHVEAPEKVGDRTVYVLNGDAQGHIPVRLYLDQQTGLLLRMMHFIETPLGDLPTQIDYGDYRDVDGVKVPFRISAIRPNTRNTIQLDQVQQDVPVEDAKFTKPAAR